MAYEIMSTDSSMFSSSIKIFSYGGPSVPAGYQSLSGCFSGASPSSEASTMLIGLFSSNAQALTTEYIFKFSRNNPQDSSSGGYIPLGGKQPL